MLAHNVSAPHLGRSSLFQLLTVFCQSLLILFTIACNVVECDFPISVPIGPLVFMHHTYKNSTLALSLQMNILNAQIIRRTNPGHASTRASFSRAPEYQDAASSALGRVCSDPATQQLRTRPFRPCSIRSSVYLVERLDSTVVHSLAKGD